MRRLIAADKLKTELEKAISKNEDMDCLDFLRVASVIDAQPTAYDPDRVVEQLEEERENVGFLKATTEASAYIRGINDAIKIVKGGGIDG